MNLVRRSASGVLWLGFALAATACGSIPERTFEFRAINFQGTAVPCLVVIDRDFPAALEAERYTDCDARVAFTKDRMHVRVFPAPRDSNGQILPPDPAATATAEYLDEARELKLEDPRIHLFILRSNPDYIPGG